ncbi:MAG: hypothetical protein WAN46_07380, partial [Gammaproteobacteria bacterium]
LEGVVVEEKAQQIEVTRPELPAQKEIAAQSAIEVFDQRACPMEVVGELGDRGLCGVELALEVTNQTPQAEMSAGQRS